MGLQWRGKGWDYSGRGRGGATVEGEGVGLQWRGKGWDYSGRGRGGATVEGEVVVFCIWYGRHASGT